MQLISSKCGTGNDNLGFIRMYRRGVPSEPGRIMTSQNCFHLFSQLSRCFTDESTVVQSCSVNVLGSRDRKELGTLAGAEALRPVPMDRSRSGCKETTSDQIS